MKKLLLIAMFALSLCGNSMAQSYGTNAMISATYAVSITDNATTHAKSRAVWVGTTQSIDLSFDGTNWVTFQGATAGEIIDAQVVGARKTAASAAPTAGDVVFLY